MGVIVIAALLAQFAIGCSLAEPAGTRPNIVLLLIDDLGWSDLPAYGNRFHETPVIDRLAAEGVRFTDFYATSPVCSAARATLQTGQYPARTGITDFIPGHWRPFEKLIVPEIDHHLRDGTRTMGDALKSAGYATAYFGKWHLGSEPAHLPEQYGYEVTERRLGRAFRRWRGKQPPGPKKIDVLTDAALWFIERSRGVPFFVTLSHYAVHIPLKAKVGTFAKYEKKARPKEGVNNATYAALIENLDTSIGRILAKLEELELDRNTIVIFTSENGGLNKVYTGEGGSISTNAPLRGEKGTLYEGGVRVPLIVKWPGVVKGGSVIGETATLADLFPTVCEIASAKMPAQEIDGVSLKGLLEDPAASLGRATVYFHYPHYHHSRPAGALRSGDWKLIEFFDDGSLELYDLASDLGESDDLSESRPEVAKRLQGELAKWREHVGARLPRPNPNYDSKRAMEWMNRPDSAALRRQATPDDPP